MSSWPGCSVGAVRWICLVGAARFVGVVSRCGSYGRSARSSMRFMRSSSLTVSTWAGAVVLIAQTPDCVLGWYAARSENSRAWGALMSRIAPPALVVTDGGSGFAKACKNIWPATRVQRCTFHAYCRIRQATTTRPKLEASRSLYALGRQLTHVQDN